MTKEKEKISTALQRLEKIVEDLGKDDVDVETGLEKFSEGVALIKFLRDRLKKAENEFVKLKGELDLDEQSEDEKPGETDGENA